MLWIRDDDGFVAYINGSEAAEQNAAPDLAWDSEATVGHNDGEAMVFEGMDVSHLLPLIVPGDNLLAIHGLNDGLTSSDFLIAVELEGRTPCCGARAVGRQGRVAR